MHFKTCLESWISSESEVVASNHSTIPIELLNLYTVKSSTELQKRIYWTVSQLRTQKQTYKVNIFNHFPIYTFSNNNKKKTT